MITVETARRRPVEQNKEAGDLLARLDTTYAFWVILALFITALLVWDFIDHRIPNHDSAWHALYSADVHRFLIHPRDWTLANLAALGKQHTAYPPGAWAFNGFLKIFFGDGYWGDKLCLVVQSLILAFSFYKLAFLSLGSKAKANLGLIVLLSFPLVCVLQRQPLIDLLQLSMFTCFLASLMHWKKSPSWKNAMIAGLLMGFHCLTKQTGVLYSGPVVALLFFGCIWKREYKNAVQLAFIGFCAPLFLLLFWFLPNYNEISQYIKWRSPQESSLTAKLLMIFGNLKISSGQIFQGGGPVFLLASLPLLLMVRKESSNNWKNLAITGFASIGGWILIITLAYYNMPESRYFGPVFVFLALLIAALGADALRSSLPLQRLWGAGLFLLSPLQMLLLCFQPAPLVKAPLPLNVSPSFDYLGIQDGYLRAFLGYDRAGDPWKQKWIFDQISAVDKIRWVWLNVLPSSMEFDQGSLVYLGQREKSHAIPISWRTTMSDMTDSFKYSPAEYRSIDWFLLKTGNQGSIIKDSQSLATFNELSEKIQQAGDYELKAQTDLPDGTMLKLYRKDYTGIWNRDAAKRLAKQATNPATTANPATASSSFGH